MRINGKTALPNRSFAFKIIIIIIANAAAYGVMKIHMMKYDLYDSSFCSATHISKWMKIINENDNDSEDPSSPSVLGFLLY